MSSATLSKVKEFNLPESRYECPICIFWLDEPVLTSCGHRFCRSCIESWLKDRGQCCPLDNKLLSFEQDIFPDNFTKREIAQIKSDCPNCNLGCRATPSPLEMDQHLIDCEFQKRTIKYECPFMKLNCDFTSKNETELKEHITEEMPEHLNLMMSVLNRSDILNNIDKKQWDAPNKTASNGVKETQADENLIRGMYERIVVLEQKSREQEMKIDKLTKDLTLLKKSPQDCEARYANGVIIWELCQFTKKIELMSSNPNTRFYSPQAYTSPFGYKFCARMNIPPKTKNYLSLHVHMMQSENDFHLDWPFKGRIKISMIHPKEQSQSQHDTIMSKPEILAFHQPGEEISPRGFGFLEYANLSDILGRGFVSNDRLIIKIQMNIV